MDSREVVLATNQRFYDAHEGRDLDLMRSVWEDSERVVCIHPGWPILRGYEPVLESWARILSGPGRNQFILTNIEVQVADGLAWVTLDENLVDAAAGRTGTVAATNAFAPAGDGWRMVLHHGSPVMS